MPRRCIAGLWVALFLQTAVFAQWTNTGGGDHGGADWTPANGTFVAGVHTNVGNFTVAAGTTIFIQPYNGVSFGSFEVDCNQNISIAGTVNGDNAGFTGGAGGAGGPGSGCDCSPDKNGTGGSAGTGPGAGGAGVGPGAFSCPGSGGSGAGGAAFGGTSGTGGFGRQSQSGCDGGSGGNGFAPGAGGGAYGDNTTEATAKGSGGGGGGGGMANRSNCCIFGAASPGTAGTAGGAGGAEIRLINDGCVGNTLTVSGTVTANGSTGGAGGSGVMPCGSCGGCGGGAGGGGGGAAGGGILLKAWSVQVTAVGVVRANGGAGGSGGNSASNGCTLNIGGGNGGAGGGGGRIKASTAGGGFSNAGTMQTLAGAGGAAGNPSGGPPGTVGAAGGAGTILTTLAYPTPSPNTPANVAPANGSTATTLTPTLTGSAYSDPNGDPQTGAQFQLRTSAGAYGGAGSFDSGVLGAVSSWTTPMLVSGTTYFWHVRYSEAPSCFSGYSAETSFLVPFPPNTPTNVAPANGSTVATGTPTLTGSAYSDPNAPPSAQTGAQFQMRTSVGAYGGAGSFDSGVLGAVTSWTTPILVDGTTYFWRVRYQNSVPLWSAWSAETSFIVPPPTVANPQPPNGTTVNTLTPTLSAFVTAPFAGTNVWADFNVDGTGFVAGSVVMNSGTSSYTTPSLLRGNHTWQVRAHDATGGLSASLGPFGFTVVVGGWLPPVAGASSGGGISNTAANSIHPTLALNPISGLPGIAWQDTNTAQNVTAIFFREMQGSAFVEFAASASAGGVSNNTTNASNPSLAYDATGAPVIAWQNATAGGATQVYVRRFSGGAWSELAGSGSGNGISNTASSSVLPSLAINPVTGNPGVAWVTFSLGSGRVFFREYNGAAWVDFAGSGSGQGLSADDGNGIEPSLAYDATGRPIVAWSDDTSGTFEVYVRRFDGASWAPFGGSSSGGGVSNAPLPSRHPSLQVDANGNPCVVWQQQTSSGGSQIFGRRWTGAAWGDFGPGSAAGGGISSTPNGGIEPHLCTSTPGGTGLFFLSWTDFSDPEGDTEIYGKYYSGGNWMQIGVASAQNGGISNDSTPSSWSGCGMGGNFIYVCWQDYSNGNFEIFVKSLQQITPPDAPKEVVATGGTGSGGQYRVFSNGTAPVPYAPLDLRTLAWAAYDSANGAMHPACGDVEGVGVDDVVLGLGSYPSAGGWVAIYRDNSALFSLVAWILFPWSQYNAANGEIYPACGDLYGTGQANVVLGQGSFPGGGGGYCAIFGGAARGFPFLRWIHGGGSTYDAANGAVHPACGDVDGDGLADVAMGFGYGGGGLVQVFDDATHGYVQRGTIFYANAAYDANNGTTWPTIAGATGQTGPEVVVGPGVGGNGIAFIYGGSSSVFAQIGSMTLPWGDYDSQVGELRLSAGTTDASGNQSVVAGLGTYPANGGWLYAFGNVTTGSTSGRWFRYVNSYPSYNGTNGETFPAVGQLR